MSDDRKADSISLRNVRAVLPNGVTEVDNLLIENGRIASAHKTGAGRADAVDGLDLAGLTLFPGFVDIHIHGSVGVDLMEATADDLHRVARFLAARGVTAWLPTLVPAPDEDYRRAVGAITELMQSEDERPAAARTLGVHYEGPFVNRRQCGALRTDYFRTFKSDTDADSLPRVGRAGAVHMMTVAPEVEGGVELVRRLTSQGWVVSVGHTRADVETLERAREAGARHMTHFLNAMSPLHHREPGPVGWGLLRDDVTCDVIADGVHSDPLALRLVLRCKTAGRVALISDAVAPAGLGDGEYRVWGETITVKEGRTSNERGSIAGSVITMRDAFSLVSSLGVAHGELALMSSLNPARSLGIERECGSIEEGKRADLVALDEEGNVRLTIVGGRVAYDARENDAEHAGRQ